MIRLTRVTLLSSLLAFTLSLGVSIANAETEVDPTDPWQHDRAAHQERMNEQQDEYQKRWQPYFKERYKVDAVGVVDKEGARAEYDKKHAPVDLKSDADEGIAEEEVSEAITDATTSESSSE